jgi:hypothetical protein
MELTHYHIDQTFDFKGSFDMPSRCGLKISQKGEQTIVIVTELYKENPGTTITSVTCSLAEQICEAFHILPEKMIYLECAPGMNSKLNFYDEVYYLVQFDIEQNRLTNPRWTQLNDYEKSIYL